MENGGWEAKNLFSKASVLAEFEIIYKYYPPR